MTPGIFNFSDHPLFALLGQMDDGVYFVDKTRTIRYWNPAAERITGYKAEQVEGRMCSNSLLMHVDQHGESLCQHRCPLLDSIEARCTHEAKVFLHHADGQRKLVRVRTMPLTNPDGEVIGGIECFTDLSNEGLEEDRLHQLERMAYLDENTGVANRRYLMDTLQARIDECQRGVWTFSLAMCDVDHFKHFNDTYGHPVGDRVLKAVAKTLTAAVRPYDLVARYGGEEFALILPNTTLESARPIVERCRTLVAESFIDHQDGRLGITMSFGLALCTACESAEALIRRADQALYQSKRAGRNRVMQAA